MLKDPLLLSPTLLLLQLITAPPGHDELGKKTQTVHIEYHTPGWKPTGFALQGCYSMTSPASLLFLVRRRRRFLVFPEVLGWHLHDLPSLVVMPMCSGADLHNQWSRLELSMCLPWAWGVPSSKTCNRNMSLHYKD